MSATRTSKLKSELKIELNGIQRIFSLVGEQIMSRKCMLARSSWYKKDVKIVHL